VDRLAKLVEDMLDISRIELGRLAFVPELMDLGDLVRDVSEGFAEQFASSNCNVSQFITDGIVGFWDRSRLEQVVFNLFSNAMKYAPGKNIVIRVERKGEDALFSIQDEGPGVAKLDQERIFQRFERAVSAYEVSGLGLGLYICKQIVEAHNGTLTVESDLGKGAIFKVQLPIEGLGKKLD
ncbi:MAG: sensor histidine kinase, partial [Bacteriovorax sp.]